MLNRIRFNNDRGSQYTSVAFTERLVEAGIDASVGTTGDSYDNALAESINVLYKTELATSSDEETRKLLAEQPGADNELLSAMLGDASEAVRFVAARRLAERGEHGAKPVLRQMVSKGSSEAVTALVLLNRLGEKSEHPQLGVVEQAALPVEKRMQLVESVQNLDPGIALPLLMQAARDPEPLVRRLVVEVASDLPGTTLKSTPGIPVLRVLANDSDAAATVRGRGYR